MLDTVLSDLQLLFSFSFHHIVKEDAIIFFFFF